MPISIHKILYLFVFFVMFIPCLHASSFTSKECLEDQFQLKITHKTPPFGLFENVLNMEKNQCILKIKITRFKYLRSNWSIDVCREPVHIKEGDNGIEILKKPGDCLDEEFKESPYCDEYEEIMATLQDDGLIFAKGEKENLKSDHGHIYCSFFLLTQYLGEGIVFSRHTVDKLFGNKGVLHFFRPFANYLAPSRQELKEELNKELNKEVKKIANENTTIKEQASHLPKLEETVPEKTDPETTEQKQPMDKEKVNPNTQEEKIDKGNLFF